MLSRLQAYVNKYHQALWLQYPFGIGSRVRLLRKVLPFSQRHERWFLDISSWTRKGNTWKIHSGKTVNLFPLSFNVFNPVCSVRSTTVTRSIYQKQIYKHHVEQVLTSLFVHDFYQIISHKSRDYVRDFYQIIRMNFTVHYLYEL